MAEDNNGGARHVVMIAANPAVSPMTGWPIGFWWAEVTHAWWAFREAGYRVTIASPAGGELQADGFSDPEDASGYSAHDILSLGFKHGAETAALLQATPAVAEIDTGTVDAIYVAGGQSPMVTMIDDATLHRFVADFYETGKPTALVCHGTCVLLKARLSSGALLVEGRTWTGFADAEEKYADDFVGRKIQPFWIEEAARRIEGTNFITAGAFQRFAVRDGNLITGQQQMSGAVTAAKLIEALGR